MPRPLLDIDEKLVADLAFDGASNREIAAIVGCDESTIRDRFPALLTKRRAERRIWLRAAQNKAVNDGNITMAIFLGKQELEQSDKSEVKQTGQASPVVILPAKDIHGPEASSGAADAVPVVDG